MTPRRLKLTIQGWYLDFLCWCGWHDFARDFNATWCDDQGKHWYWWVCTHCLRTSRDGVSVDF